MQLQRAEGLRSNAGFSGAAVARRLEDADAFLDSRLGQLHNLSLVHDQTVARIAAAQRALDQAEPGSAEHKRAAHLITKLEARVDRIAAEEARRKAAHHARERQRLSTGRDVSTLTNIINAKVRVCVCVRACVRTHTRPRTAPLPLPAARPSLRWKSATRALWTSSRPPRARARRLSRRP